MISLDLTPEIGTVNRSRSSRKLRRWARTPGSQLWDMPNAACGVGRSEGPKKCVAIWVLPRSVTWSAEAKERAKERAKARARPGCSPGRLWCTLNQPSRQATKPKAPPPLVTWRWDHPPWDSMLKMEKQHETTMNNWFNWWVSMGWRVSALFRMGPLDFFTMRIHSAQSPTDGTSLIRPLINSIFRKSQKLMDYYCWFFPIFLTYWCVLRREFSGMIHVITSNNHPSNHQQPIHSLRLAPVRKKILVGGCCFPIFPIFRNKLIPFPQFRWLLKIPSGKLT